MKDSKEIPRLPDDALPHVRVTHFRVVENSDLNDQVDVSQLVGLLYDHPEDDLYFFKQHDHPTNRHLQSAVNAGVIVMTEWKRNFYPHPLNKRDYVQLDKHRLKWDWEREVVLTSPMFIRFELKLTARARRKFEQEELIAAQKYADRNPLELKPGIWGISFDLYKGLDWLRRLFGKRPT